MDVDGPQVGHDIGLRLGRGHALLIVLHLGFLPFLFSLPPPGAPFGFAGGSALVLAFHRKIKSRRVRRALEEVSMDRPTGAIRCVEGKPDFMV
jgi:hypothetical protein